jgi:anti-sigma factor RsiW
MRCPIETQDGPEQLLAYSSGRLEAAAKAGLEGHIRDCGACRDFTSSQRAVWDALDQWKAAPISPDFDRRLYQRIDREVGWWDFLMRPFRPLLFRQGLPVAAAAGLLIFAGILLERPIGTPPGSVHDSSQVEPVSPDQAEPALQEMEIMREFSRLVHQESAEPRM